MTINYSFAEKKQMRRNQAVISTIIDDDKTKIQDPNTGLIVSKCGMDVSKLSNIFKFSDNTSCAFGDNYSGSCWVSSLGFKDEKYKILACHQDVLGKPQCVEMGANESKDKWNTIIKNFGVEDIGYEGGFKGDQSDCPDTTTNINAIGYSYIYEATDNKYKNADDFRINYCNELAQNYNPGNCSSPSKCPCDNEACKKNKFLPPLNSTIWLSASESVKECYLCLQKYRAVNFYCNKVYQCINNSKNEIYQIAKSSKRETLKKLYGNGNYTCAYYDGNLCGCAKTKLSGGPRHFLRIARNDNNENKDCESKEDLQNRPQCNLFESGIYVRQFRNEEKKDLNAQCPYDLKPELGYEKRGTFFFPKLTIVSGINERVIGYKMSIFENLQKKRPSSDENYYFNYFYNTPIGEGKYDTNNYFSLPTSNKIVYSHFYPVIFTIGNMYNMLDEDGNCKPKPSKSIYYIVLRLEYNITTNSSALVAYSVSSVNNKPTSMGNEFKTTDIDGTILKFATNNSYFLQTFKTFDYDYDTNSNIQKQDIEYKGNWLVFENIGKVERPPLKYSYDDGYVVGPLVLEENLSSTGLNIDYGATSVNLSIVPENLERVNKKEFKDDMVLPISTAKLTIQGTTAEALELATNNEDSEGLTSSAIMYMKKFSAGYPNNCTLLKEISGAVGREKLKNPPSKYEECTNMSNNQDRINCLMAYLLVDECNEYMSCLPTSTNLEECKAEGRIPEIKMTGNDNDIQDYRINTDLRSLAKICITDGFDIADKLSTNSNTKLFGNYGNPVYDYTIRYKREKSKFSSLTRPLTLIGMDTEINQPNNEQDKPNFIVKLDNNYFNESGNKFEKLLSRLKGSYIIDKKNLPTKTTLFTHYASDCLVNEELCRNRFEVAHRQIQEIQGKLCITSSTMNGGQWNLFPRDLGTDFHVYIPLRCQYVYFSGLGAGGAGMTSIEDNGCVAQWHITLFAWLIYGIFPAPAFPSLSYRRIPKFDATGSSGGFVSTIIDMNKIPVFDSYFNVRTGTTTQFLKTTKSASDDKCYKGAGISGAGASKTWNPVGGTHSFWKGDNKYDLKKGNTEIGFDTHGAFSLASGDAKKKMLEEKVQKDISTFNNYENSITINNLNDLLKIEFYFVSLMYSAERLNKINLIIYNTKGLIIKQLETEAKIKMENAKNAYEEAKKNECTQSEKTCQQSTDKTYCYNQNKINQCNTIDNQIQKLKNEYDIAQNEYSTKSFLTDDKVFNYNINNSNFDNTEIIKNLNEINSQISNEKTSWNGCNPNNTSCAGTNTSYEDNTISNIEGVIKHMNENIEEVNDIIADATSDTAKTYFNRVINFCNEIKDIKQEELNFKANALNSIENIETNNISTLKDLNKIFENTKTYFEKIYKLATSIQNNKYKSKFEKIKEYYDKAFTYTKCNKQKTNYIDKYNCEEKNSFFPLYGAMCEAFSINETPNNLCINDNLAEIEKDDREKLLSYILGERELVKDEENNYEYYNKKRIIVVDADDYFTQIDELFSLAKNVHFSLEELEEEKKDNTISNSAYQMLAKAERGISPIDCRINSSKFKNCPFIDNNQVDSGIFRNAFPKSNGVMPLKKSRCAKTGLYQIDVKLTNICHELPLPGKYVSNTNNGAYANYVKSYVNEAKGYCSISSGLGSRMSTDTDRRVELGNYNIEEGMQNSAPGSEQKSSELNEYHNVPNKTSGSGGAFKHRSGTGAGGDGDLKLNVDVIKIKQGVYQGNRYPIMDINGVKQIDTDISNGSSDAYCKVRCSPIYVEYTDFPLYFDSIKSERKVNLICEYVGLPETDMEVPPNTTANPHKCYITSDISDDIHGNLKGKILAESGYCAIAKCKNGIWGFTDMGIITDKNKYQYDRKGILCKYLNKYDGVSKTSWYYAMMFDKNIYSSMSYDGGRIALTSKILNTGKMHTLANCAENETEDYISDTYSQLSSADLSMVCNGGFWSKGSKQSATGEFFNLEEDKYNKTGNSILDEILLKQVASSQTYDRERNSKLDSNNKNMYNTEYLIKDITYQLSNGEYTTGIKKIDEKLNKGSNKGESFGRQVLKDKVKCPPIINLYDFDENYSGNAIWDSANEYDENVTAISCRSSDKNIFFQKDDNKPTRMCTRNGIWGPVINPCLKGCPNEVDSKGILWSMSNGYNISPIDENTAIVSGGCSNKYLNSQNLISSSGGAKRNCNLLTGNWENESNISSICTSTLGCPTDNISKNNNDYIYNPFARVISVPYDKYSIDNTNTQSINYKTLFTEINNGVKDINEYTKYNETIYLSFEKGNSKSKTFNTEYYTLNTKYASVKFLDNQDFSTTGNNSSSKYIMDQNNVRLISSEGVNTYFVIKVKNLISPEAYKYMLAQGDDTRNEFINVKNWASTLFDSRQNYTGQWKFKGNMDDITFSGVLNQTAKETQEIYKNTELLVFIAKSNNKDIDIRRISLFSPYYAMKYAVEQNVQYDFQEDTDIKFRIPFDISISDYDKQNDPYPIIIYDGYSSSSRVYRFEWKKQGDDWRENTGQMSYAKHKIGQHNCNGKYAGFIKHNTMKHIMYTNTPIDTKNIYFSSLYCYDGRIYGFSAFKMSIRQLIDTTDSYTPKVFLGTNNISLNTEDNTYNCEDNKKTTECIIYQKIIEQLQQTDEGKNTISLNEYYSIEMLSYIAKMFIKYWQPHILPTEEKQRIFVNNYIESYIDEEHTDDDDIKYVLRQYALGNNGYYFRVVPRRAEWITGVKSNVVSNRMQLAELDEFDPYCEEEDCLFKKETSDIFNNNVKGDNTWAMCE